MYNAVELRGRKHVAAQRTSVEVTIMEAITVIDVSK